MGGTVGARVIPEIEIAGAGASLSLKIPFGIESKVSGHFHVKHQKGTFGREQSSCYVPSCQHLAKQVDWMSDAGAYCDANVGGDSLVQLPRNGVAAFLDFSIVATSDVEVGYTLLD